MVDVVASGPYVDQHHNIALPWYEGGCSVVPIRPGGTKAPYFDWYGLKEQRPSRDDVRLWFEAQYPNAGVAVICGKISGNLELVELEGRAADGDSLTRIQEQCNLRGVAGIWSGLLAQGYAEWSPSGGIHVLYRVPEHDIAGNTKLAMREALPHELTNEELRLLEQNPNRKYWRTLAETRGEGGYVVVAPTGGHCHKSGEPWKTVSGEQGVFQEITWAQRMSIHAAISAALDERPVIPEPPQSFIIQSPRQSVNGHKSTGDDFNERASWEDGWFTGQGWRISHRSNDEIFWVRPGKEVRDGHSASTGYAGDVDRLYIWSSSTDLPMEKPLNKFFVYSHYHHGGDMVEAARVLREQGYGSNVKSQALAVLRALDFGDGVGTNASTDLDLPLPGLGGYQLTDTDSGRRLCERSGDKFRFNTAEKAWYMWAGHAWTEDKTFEIQRAAVKSAELTIAGLDLELRAVEGTNAEKDVLKRLGQAKMGLNNAKLVATIARFQTEKGIAVIPEQFDQDMNLLNLPNGTLDLTTGEVRPADPQDLITLTFGASYDPSATCPKFRKFIEEVFPFPRVQAYVQRALGYSLLGQPTERVMFLLHGPSGTGKSVLTSVLTRVFGDYGITAPATTFRLKKNETSVDVHQLRGRRFVATSEMPEGALLDEELVKRVTGGDEMTSRRLYEDYQQWNAQCVVWIATNFLPKVNGDDNAMWRRAKTVRMSTEFGVNGKVEILGYSHQLIKERDGILNWLLEGLEQYRAQGLNQPPEITADIDSYRTDADAVASFIRDKLDDGALVRGDGLEIKSPVLNRLYINYCEENRLQPLGARRFAHRLRAQGFTSTKVGGVITWNGIEHIPGSDF